MQTIPKIPESDLKAINDSFKQSFKPLETLGRDSFGVKVVNEKKIVNSRGYEISDFRGRILKRQMSLVREDKQQIVIGVEGQSFDSIPIDLRTQILWVESDFE